jgi:hypothetical protein
MLEVGPAPSLLSQNAESLNTVCPIPPFPYLSQRLAPLHASPEADILDVQGVPLTSLSLLAH